MDVRLESLQEEAEALSVRPLPQVLRSDIAHGGIASEIIGQGVGHVRWRQGFARDFWRVKIR